jgi:two-component system, NarL family, nitrate/nitrite response regulator NarL
MTVVASVHHPSRVRDDPAMPPARVQVVVADDHPLFREGIVRALEEDDRFVVAGEAGDGAAAEALIRDRSPHVALLDLRMPGRDALQLLARLRHREPPVAVVVLTAYTDAGLVHSAMAAGAAAYVAKESDRDDIHGPGRRRHGAPAGARRGADR